MKIKKVLAAGLLGLMSLGAVTAAPIKIGYSDWPGYTVLDRRLDSVEPSIPSQFIVQIPTRAAVVAQAPHALGEFRMVGGDHAGISGRAEVFSRIETECGRRAKRTAAAP